MTASRSLSPEAMSRIQRLELEARGVVEGFLSGQHRSPYLGQSLEFAQHREYVPGDDIRRIDWKVWSKTDKLYLKQYEEETNLRTTLVVDASESMQFGSTPDHAAPTDKASKKQPRTKFDQACRATAAIAYLLLRQQDSVGLVTFDDGVRNRVPHRTGELHLRTILQALSVEETLKKTDVLSVLREVSDQKTLRGLVVLISDLFLPMSELKKSLELIRRRGHDVLVIHTLDDQELDFDFSGTTKFVGLESDAELTCDPRSLRAGYMEKLHEFLDNASRTCVRAGCEYALIKTSDQIGAALAAFVSRRTKRRR